jgi:hypothetical protein
MSLLLEWDQKALGVTKKIDRAITSALSKAGGDSIRAARASAKREIRNTTRIKAKYLANKALPLTFPRGRKTINSLVWRMDVSGAAVPMGEYPRRKVKAGVSVEIKKGKRVLVKSAFLARTKTGVIGVFRRPSKERYPMGHLLTSRVSDIFPSVEPRVSYRAQFVFRNAFARLLSLEIAKTR